MSYVLYIGYLLLTVKEGGNVILEKNKSDKTI